MKFLKSEFFLAHLEKALPDHPSSLYAVLVKDPFERRYLTDRVLSYYPKGKKEVYLASQFSVKQLIEEINSPDLFFKERVLIYDEIERITPSMGDELAFSLKKGVPSDLVLILSGASFPPRSSLYQELKKEIVAADLSFEKPWERKNRLHRWLLDLAHKRGKTIEAPVVKALLEGRELDFSFLCSEFDKLVAFVGEKKTIDLSALEISGDEVRAQTGWELSDALIWEKGGGDLSFSCLHETAFYSLIGQLRYQLKLGLCIATALERGSEEELPSIFPKLRPTSLAKYYPLCRERKASYFLHGLRALCDLEWRSRLGMSPHFLLSQFALQLHRGREL